MSIIVPTSASPFLREQRTKKDVTDEQRAEILASEMADLPQWLSFTPTKILEIGCGVGIGLVALHQMFPAASLTGIDGDGPAVPRSMWMPGNEVAWNSLDVTRMLLQANNTTARLVSIDDAKALAEPFDLAVSFCALGWHWPIQQELALLDRCGVNWLYTDCRINFQGPVPGWDVQRKKQINPKRVRCLLQRKP